MRAAASQAAKPRQTEEMSMHPGNELADLPEAMPLERVAPFWRILAILAVIGVIGLLFVALTLGLALAQRSISVSTATPPAAVWPTAVAGGAWWPPAATDDFANLPYPVKQDLAGPDAFEPPEEKPAEANQPAPSARQRFLAKGVDVWKADHAAVDVVTVSADGSLMAYLTEGRLLAGPLGNAQEIAGPDIPLWNLPAGAMAGTVGKPRRGLAKSAAPAMTAPAAAITGVPNWVKDSPIIVCADVDGTLRKLIVTPPANQGITGPVDEVLPYGGAWPASFGADANSLVFVRAGLPIPKLEVPRHPAARDPTEIVQVDLTTREIRVLVPASNSSWSHLALSPDATKLALVSDRGYEGQQPRPLRVFVLELESGKLRPISPPASQVGPVCWTLTGDALIYARSQEPEPADHWLDRPASPHRALDLFLWDLKTNRETRLSRGGGFFSPSLTLSVADSLAGAPQVAPTDRLFYLTENETESGSTLLLRHMSLQDARDFGSREPEPTRRDLPAWTALADQLLAESKVPGNIERIEVTPAFVAELAKSFQRIYRERFHMEPPATTRGILRLRQELQALESPETVRRRFALVATALEADYLVHRQNALWRFSRGHRLQPVALGQDESSFGYVMDPSTAAKELTNGLAAWLRKAEGRTLVFSNDAALGKKALAELTDPRLAKGTELLITERMLKMTEDSTNPLRQPPTELLKQNKASQGEQVLLEMLKDKRHEKNYHLALEVGKLLYDHQRKPAVLEIMEEQCDQWPREARKFNLLGLAAMEANPQKAVEAFQKALRCDLQFEPAYLNLAQAFQKSSNPVDEERCLRRYLELMPNGAYTTDARLRLARLRAPGN